MHLLVSVGESKVRQWMDTAAVIDRPHKLPVSLFAIHYRFATTSIFKESFSLVISVRWRCREFTITHADVQAGCHVQVLRHLCHIGNLRLNLAPGEYMLEGDEYNELHVVSAICT